MPLIRVGQPGSPVKPGDPVPSKPNQYYESGQFSPDIDELTIATLTSANESGLISTKIPIFDEYGEISPEMVEAWNPKDDLADTNIRTFSQTLPKFTFAGVVGVHKRFPWLYNLINLSNISNGQFGSSQEADQSEGQDQVALAGEAIISMKANYQSKIFKSAFMVYPAYYKYVSVPLVPAIKGRTSGLSVATFATISAAGNALFSRMTYEGQYELVGKFMNASGWSKLQKGDAKKGSYMGRTNQSSWYRDDSKPAISEISKYSPMDDFSDTFAQYLTHRVYLAKKSPEKTEVMSQILEHYGVE